MIPGLRKSASAALAVLFAFGAPAEAIASAGSRVVIMSRVAAPRAAPLVGVSAYSLSAYGPITPLSATSAQAATAWTLTPVDALGAHAAPAQAALLPSTPDAVEPTTPLAEKSHSAAPSVPIRHAGSEKTFSSSALNLGHQIALHFDVPEIPPAVDEKELPPPADAPKTLAEAPLDIDTTRTYHSSPKNGWSLVMAQFLPDRLNFAGDGEKKTFGDPRLGNTRHGGNIRGMTDKLPYFKSLGADVVVPGPVAMGTPDAYHGYATTHFLAVDPYLGTRQDYAEFVRTAHALGMYVVQDFVLNHSGPVHEPVDGNFRWIGDGIRKKIKWVRDFFPKDFNAEDWTLLGEAYNLLDPLQAKKGDFMGLRTFDTDKKPTQDKLIHIAKWWIKEFEIGRAHV